MRTEQLIADLARDARAVPRASLQIAAMITAGSALALVGLTAAFGSPLQPIAERGLAASAMKLIYPLIVAAFGAAAGLAAGRPGDRMGVRLLPIFAAVLVIAIVATLQLLAAAPAGRQALLFGTTFSRCVTAVILASIPVFAGFSWAFRSLAPTRPSLAGFLVGLSSGGAAAAAYALFCPEISRVFLITAYTPAMLVPAVLGALAGPRLFRW